MSKICAIGISKMIRGALYTKEKATSACAGCAFLYDGCAFLYDTCPGNESIRTSIEDGGCECSGTIWTPAATESKPTKTTAPWEADGFVPGAQVRPTGLSWNKSPNSKKWIGCVGTVVAHPVRKSKGITVEFLCKENHFPEVFVYHPSNLQLVKPEEPKMPKENKTPESKSPLYLALREFLETKDRETLDTRTENLLAQVQGLVGGVVPVETPEMGTKESVGI